MSLISGQKIFETAGFCERLLGSQNSFDRNKPICTGKMKIVDKMNFENGGPTGGKFFPNRNFYLAIQYRCAHFLTLACCLVVWYSKWSVCINSTPILRTHQVSIGIKGIGLASSTIAVVPITISTITSMEGDSHGVFVTFKEGKKYSEFHPISATLN